MPYQQVFNKVFSPYLVAKYVIKILPYRGRSVSFKSWGLSGSPGDSFIVMAFNIKKFIYYTSLNMHGDLIILIGS